MTSTCCSRGSDEDSVKEIIRRVAIILTGISLLMSFRLATTCGSYAVKRFGISVAETGVFIQMMLDTSQVFLILGLLITTVYTMARGYFRKKDIYISIALSWLNFLAFVVILLSYFLGGEKGYVTWYYWSVVFAAFAYGLHQTIVLSMIGDEMPYYFIGLPCSGVIVVLFHVITGAVYKWFQISGVEFDLVVYQITIGILLWLFTSLLWTYSFRDYKVPGDITDIVGATDDSSGESYNYGDVSGGFTFTPKNVDVKLPGVTERIWSCASPFFLNIFGAALTYFFYPGIAPYQLVGPTVGYIIDLLVLFFSTLAATALIVLVHTGVGPNGRWDGEIFYYHFTWLFLIPEYLVMLILLLVMHYPASKMGMVVRGNGIWVGMMTVVIRLTDDCIRGICLTGVGKQSGSGDGDGDMAALTNFIAQFLLTLFSFLGLGYLKEYRSFARDWDNWPTDGLSWCASALFWIKIACIGGWKAFAGSFTLNVRKCFEPFVFEDIDIN